MSEISDTTTANTATSASQPRAIRYKQAALLLEKWLADDSQYDTQTWAHLQAELQDAATQCEATDETPS